MKTIQTITQIQEFHQQCQQQNKTIALVPTMGGLHAGHFALIKQAKKLADVVIISIFVNPNQFGKNEDLATYPGTLSQDTDLLADFPVDVIFSPSVSEIYPLADPFTLVAPSIANTLCGKSRPVFFHGITLVVLKLLLAIKPDFAIFGQKDYQQTFLIKKLTQEFFIPTQIIDIPTVRDPDGLAISTRNQYLTATQRKIAPKFYQIINNITLNNVSILDAKQNAIAQLTKYFQVDYLEIVDTTTLLPCKVPVQKMRIIAALTLGEVRLIDNIAL